MSRSGLIFALFCLGVVSLYFLASRNGYSPFARGGGEGAWYRVASDLLPLAP